MTDAPYRLIPGQTLKHGTRDVIQHSKGVTFNCPCGERRVWAGPHHTISFDDDGLLTLAPSCGSHAGEINGVDRPQNWCHFWIKNGQAEMCGDAQCPGGALG